MRIQELGFLFLLSTALATKVQSEWEDQESLMAFLIDSGVINPQMAELLQVNCRFELLQAQSTLQNIESHFAVEKSTLGKKLLNGNEKVNNMINALLPEVDQIIAKCTRETNPIHRDTGEEKASDSWYIKYSGFLFKQNSSPSRRSLAETPLEAPAPSPTVSSPLAPTEFTASPPSIPFFPPVVNDTSFPPTATDTGEGSSGMISNNEDRHRRTVIIAVVVTASVTLVMAALLFVCWRRYCGPGSRRGGKLGNTNNQAFEKLKKSKTSGEFFVEPHSPNHLKIEMPVVIAANSAENTSAAIPGPPGPPPLKPPPGRPEPPKPPLSNVSPPAPPHPPRVGPPAPQRGPPPPPPPVPNSGPRTPPPPPPIHNGGPRPPPPPGAPRPPPPIGSKPPRPLNSGPRASSSTEEEAGSNKAKLKPFFWDKVLANPDQSMVWHQIKSGSFQFNEEMIESLFGYAPAPGGKKKDEGKKESSSQDVPVHYIQIIDPKKSHNLAIILKALNVTTEEICDALEEGNELPSELIQTFLKLAPTTEEELKLRLYNGDLSHLGPAERFLKVLVSIPFAFKRLESLLFMCTLQEETSALKESFEILEAACTELRKSRLFLKLLEAVLKTGNRMNDGTFRGGAQAFKLDTLLKLSDVKGIDGKTTLLHFVVQEIIRPEGIRAAKKALNSDDQKLELDSDEYLQSLGLEVVSGLGNELNNVKRAAAIDSDSLTGTVSKLSYAVKKAQDFLNLEMKNVPEGNGFHQTLRSFVQNAEVDVGWAFDENKRIMAMVKSTVDYFHGKSGKDEGLRLFAVVRDFLVILDKVCREVKSFSRKSRMYKKEDVVVAPPDPGQRLFQAITNRRIDGSSSDDEL